MQLGLSRFDVIVVLIVLVANTARSGFAQEGDAERFVFRQDAGHQSSTGEAKIQTGLPEGFERDSMLQEIGIGENEIAWTGWFTYGDERSQSVVVMRTSESPSRLFIDLDRDRKFNVKEVATANPDQPDFWTSSIDAEFIQAGDLPIHRPQQIQIRHDRVANQMIIATSGKMVGTAIVNTNPHLAQYVDRDGNGRWFDVADRIFVDLNGDGTLDPILERLPCQGMRVVSEQLLSIQGDRLGQKLKMELVRERGVISPTIQLLETGGQVVSVSAAIASETGIQFLIDTISQPVEVPIGTYHVARLTLRVRGAEGVFSFTFDCENSRANPITVTADSSVEMDLLGKLRVVANSATIRQGESASLLITPMVRTKSGLYLTNSSYGKLDASTENRMTSVSLFGERQFHLGSSGFS